MLVWLVQPEITKWHSYVGMVSRDDSRDGLWLPEGRFPPESQSSDCHHLSGCLRWSLSQGLQQAGQADRSQKGANLERGWVLPECAWVLACNGLGEPSLHSESAYCLCRWVSLQILSHPVTVTLRSPSQELHGDCCLGLDLPNGHGG